MNDNMAMDIISNSEEVPFAYRIPGLACLGWLWYLTTTPANSPFTAMFPLAIVIISLGWNGKE